MNRRPQLNLCVEDDRYIITQYDGPIPRREEEVYVRGKPYIVEQVAYEFNGAGGLEPPNHVNVLLREAP